MVTTRATYRRRLGEALGGFFTGSAFSGSTTTIGTAIPAFQSSELPSDALAYAWAYIPDGLGQRLRRITKNGLDGATGVVTVDTPFGAAVAGGTVFEISTKMPPTREGAANLHGEVPLLGLNEALTLASEHLTIQDDALNLTLVSGQHDYSLTTWGWLDRKARLVDVRELNALGTTYRSSGRTWEFREGVRGSTLHFTQPYRFPSGSYAVRLVAQRPVNTLIYRSGTWIETSVGMALDTDALNIDEDVMTRAALPFCYRALRDESKGAAKAMYAALYEEALADARKLDMWDRTNDIEPSTAPAPSAAGVAA